MLESEQIKGLQDDAVNKIGWAWWVTLDGEADDPRAGTEVSGTHPQEDR